MKILFVCLGNICRSPTAEGVMHAVLEEAGLSDRVAVDSAGTGAWHAGERADTRMRQHASRRGYDLTSRARQFTQADFARFDLVVVMDDDNHRAVCRLAPDSEAAERVQRFGAFCTPPIAEVPDPYYGGAAGFERVMDIVEDGCHGLLARVQDELASS
jgi:protein-tyrosine phosphatase